MRFMMLMIPNGYESAAPDAVRELDARRVEAMMAYNTALQDAGILRGLEGLHPPSRGARVSFAGGRPAVSRGPFAGATEVVGGFWMIDVASLDDAIAWASRCPASADEVIEVRQVQEMDDYSDEVREAAAGFDEMRRTSEPAP